jgi:hypothetical protein
MFVDRSEGEWADVDDHDGERCLTSGQRKCGIGRLNRRRARRQWPRLIKSGLFLEVHRVAYSPQAQQKGYRATIRRFTGDIIHSSARVGSVMLGQIGDNYGSDVILFERGKSSTPNNDVDQLDKAGQT